MRKYIYIAIGVALVALIVAAMRPRPLRVDTAAVSRGALRVTLDEEGRTQVKRRYVVSAPLAGKLLRIERRPGDRVDEGAVLARVVPADAPLLDPRARAEQQARLHAAEAALAQANAMVARAKVGASTARDDLARKQKLTQGGAGTANEVSLAESESASRVQDLASAEFGAKVADYQLGQARAALERGQSGRMDEFEILAPAAGQVLRVQRESEGVVAAGTALLEVGDSSVLEVAVDLLTVDAVRVRPGMTAVIDHWGGPTPLAAGVRSVEPSGFTKLSALGVEEQRVRVLLDLTSSAGEWRSLGDNFRVEAHIVVWEAPSVLRVPTAALFRRGDSWVVFAVENGRLALRKVEIGEQSAEQAEVKGALAEGAIVVLRPGENLHEGVRVEGP